MDEQRMGHSSGWSVEEDGKGGFRWAAYGPAGTLGGQASTRAEAEQAAQEAERELAAGPGAPGTPRARLPSTSRHGTDAAVPEGGSGLQPAPIEQLLERAIAWARGIARTDSDVDLVVLTTAPERYLASDDWAAALGATQVMRPQAWGDLTERRLLLDGGLEVEVGVTEPAWAATEPVDSGTRRVVADGLRILHDPEGRLGALVMVVAGDKL